MTNDDLKEHVFSTYLSLRYGMALMGTFLPVVLYLVGVLHGLALQDSMSAYYWAAPQGGLPPSRDWFVGGLFAIAGFLYLYKGFTVAENNALNLAAILAVGVAIFPMEWNTTVEHDGHFSAHGFCAVSMFLCLVYVVWFRAQDTLRLLSDPGTIRRYRRTYKLVSLFMLLSPLTAFVLNSFFPGHTAYVFFIEAAGIWAFALYWWIKSTELKRSNATRKALRAELQLF